MQSTVGAKNTLRIIQKPELDIALQTFLLDKQAANLSPGSLRFYHQKLPPFLDFLRARGINKVGDISADLVRAFLASLQDCHSPGGVHCFYTAVKAFCRWLFAEGEIAADPIARVKPPKVPDEPLPPADPEAIRAMLKVCDKTQTGARDSAAILCLVDSGLRAAEFLALNVGDLDMTSGAVRVHRGKGGKFRTTFLGAKSRRQVLRYLAFREVNADSPLWATATGERLSYTGLRDILRRRAKEAGVEPPTLHSCRRLFALTMLRNGADILTISRILGHSNVGLVARYARQLQDDLAAVHHRAGPVDRML